MLKKPACLIYHTPSTSITPCCACFMHAQNLISSLHTQNKAGSKSKKEGSSTQQPTTETNKVTLVIYIISPTPCCGDLQEFLNSEGFLNLTNTESQVKTMKGQAQVLPPFTSTPSSKELNMYPHRLHSAFMVSIQYEFSIRSGSIMFGIHSRQIKDLIYKFVSDQQDRISKKQKKMTENSNRD